MAFNEKYVDAAAAGGGTGTSAADPWTWDEAVANCVAGDRINVKAGTYVSNGTGTTAYGGQQDVICWRGYTTTPGDLDGKKLDGLVGGVDIPTTSFTAANGFLKGHYYAVFHLEFTNSTNYFYPVVNIGAGGYGGNIVAHCRFKCTADTASKMLLSKDAVFFDCHFIQSRCGYEIVTCNTGEFVFNSCVFEGDDNYGNQTYIQGVAINVTSSFNNCIFKNFSNAILATYANLLSVTNCTFIDIENSCIYLGTTNGGSLMVTNCYFADCNIGIDNSWQDANRTGDNASWLVAGNCFQNVTTPTLSLSLIENSITDTSNQFINSSGNDYRLSSGSLGYGNAMPESFAGLSGENGLDVGALQHADPAYVAPPDASASTKVFPFRSWVEGDFQQEGADADEFVEKHELQALPVFEFSIGTGADRDYNSLTAFFAAFDNTLVDLPNSKVIVTCYNDTGADQWISDTSTVTASCPTNCIDFLLTVDDDSWHKGQYGKGVMIKLNSSSQYALYINPVYNGGIFSVERLSVDANNQFNQNGNFRSVVYVGPLASTTYQPIPPYKLKDLYVRGGDGTPFNCRSATGIGTASRNVYIESCIVENIVGNGSATNYSTVGISTFSRSLVRNCTVNNIDSNTTTLNYGIYGGTDATYGLTENCVVTNVNNGDCYLSTLTNTSNLVADDATGTIQSTAAGEFVDAANSDYKLKGTASAAGIVAATNAKVTDVTGKLRKAGVAQDAGAFNNVAGYDDSPVFPPDQPTDPIIHPLRSN